MKKLIPTVALTLMGAAAVTGSTYAWFSMNKSVEATGMKVQATTSGALVIGKTIDAQTGYSYNFNENTANVLSHSTRDASAVYAEGDVIPSGKSVGETYATSLKTIGTDDDVDPITGIVGDDATYHEAANVEGGTQYYVDYDFFVSAAGPEQANKTITLEMTDAMKAEVSENWAYNMSSGTKGMADTLFGFTVDVYRSNVVKTGDDYTASTFVDTYHLDDVSKTLDIYTGTIPSRTATKAGGEDEEDVQVNQGIHFLLRVYLDGEYVKANAKMKACTGEQADGKTAYFALANGKYTKQNVTLGNDVSSLYKVTGVEPISEGTEKYVKTEKASTAALNLGFKLSSN